MALIDCPDCGKEISLAATSCPNCGRGRKGGVDSWGIGIYFHDKEFNSMNILGAELLNAFSRDEMVCDTRVVVQSIKNTQCSNCNGKGYLQKLPELVTCQLCKGLAYTINLKTCSACDGTGKRFLGMFTCSTCKGTGKVEQKLPCICDKGKIKTEIQNIPCDKCAGKGIINKKENIIWVRRVNFVYKDFRAIEYMLNWLNRNLDFVTKNKNLYEKYYCGQAEKIPGEEIIIDKEISDNMKKSEKVIAIKENEIILLRNKQPN